MKKQSLVLSLLLVLSVPAVSFGSCVGGRCLDKSSLCSSSCSKHDDHHGHKKKKCKKKKDKCCEAKRPEHSFKAHLTFDQILVPDLNGSGVPEDTFSRPMVDRPSTGGVEGANEVTGTFEICFNEAFSAAEYKLTIENVNFGNRNMNEQVLGACIFYYDACGAAGPYESNDMAANPYLGAEYNCRKMVTLCPQTFLNNPGNDSNNPYCGLLETEPYTNKIVCCGTITNEDLIPSDQLGDRTNASPSIAALAELIRAGAAYVSVNGSSYCVDADPRYGLVDGTSPGTSAAMTNGLIRGQLFAAETV